MTKQERQQHCMSVCVRAWNVYKQIKWDQWVLAQNCVVCVSQSTSKPCAMHSLRLKIWRTIHIQINCRFFLRSIVLLLWFGTKFHIENSFYSLNINCVFFTIFLRIIFIGINAVNITFCGINFSSAVKCFTNHL